MSCPVPQPVDAASNLADDATLFGLPVYYLREFAELRKSIQFGTLSIVISSDKDDRFTVEKSRKIRKPSELATA